MKERDSGKSGKKPAKDGKNKETWSEEDIRKIFKSIKSQSPQHYFEFTDPFWIMITTILSHRTKDEVSNQGGRNLYERYRDAKGLSMAEQKDVIALISKVGFSNVKSLRVINAAKIIVEKFNGKVPDSIDTLMEIPGIGRKTANVILADAYSIPSIAVDTHVHRIANRIGITTTNNPEKTEEALRKIIPRDMWLEFNPTLVEFGKVICKPIGPKCGECKITSMCRYFSSNTGKK